MSSEIPSTTGYLAELISREPNTPERENDVSRYILGDMQKVLGANGKAWSQKVTGRHAIGLPKRYNVGFTIEPEHPEDIEETLMFYAHLDVVPRHEEYKHFAHIRSPNELYLHPDNPNLAYALGAEDMLGPLAAVRQAARNIAKGRLTGALWPHRRIIGLFPYAEEGASHGFAAAREGGLFQGVSACATPEILVNKVPLRLPRAVGYGRVGRYGFTVICRGISCHMGAITDSIRGSMTEALYDKAKHFVTNEVSLQPHRNPEGIIPDFKPRFVGGEIPRMKALSSPEKGQFHINIFFSNPEDRISDVVGRVRRGLAEIAREAFPDDHDPEHVRYREHAFEVHPEQHPYEFAPPYKDDLDHPFHGKISSYVHQAYGIYGKPGCTLPMDQIVQPMFDTGVADCGRIADLGIPVADIYPLGGLNGDPKHPDFAGGGAHTENERLWLPSIDEIAYVLEKAAAEPQLLVPKS